MEQIGFKRGNAARTCDHAKPLQEFRADTTPLMCIGYGKGSLCAARSLGWKVLRDRDDAVVHFRDERHRVARRERAHDVADDVVNVRLSKETEVAALRREVAVKLMKLLAVVDRRLAEARGGAVAKHDVNRVRSCEHSDLSDGQAARASERVDRARVAFTTNSVGQMSPIPVRTVLSMPPAWSSFAVSGCSSRAPTRPDAACVDG